MLIFAMSNSVQDYLKEAPFSYVDGIVVIWLIIGILRGRKMGMTQELIPFFRWVGIVLVAGFFYRPISKLLYENTGGAFSLIWARVTAYVILALAVAFVCLMIKKALGDKLTGSDFFGRWEYYLGMGSGLVRFACMLLVILAVMHVRIISQKELDDINAYMKKNLEDIHPARYEYGALEQQLFTKSFTGKVVQDNLGDILLDKVEPTAVPQTESLKKKQQDAIDNALGTPHK